MIIENKNGTWFEEVHDNKVGLKLRITDKLYKKKSPFQEVEVVKTVAYGNMLTNDGMIMVTERDEFVYHDMITHVPMFTHPNPETVLVIGGGDGGTVREVLRHKSVKKCVMVEIDPLVVEACKKHIPQTAKDLEDPRVTLLIEDGVKYAKKSREKFDVILVDSSDPIGPATPLFNESFYSDLDKLLTDKGIIVSQCESPYHHSAMQKTLLGILAKQFTKTHIYNYSNLTYPSGFWSFSFASKGLCPFKDFNPQRVKDSELDFGYYSEDLHMGSFMLPAFMYKDLQEFLTPLPKLTPQ